MYWDIGRMIHQRQQEKGWGASVIPRLAVDLRNELPEVKGFSDGEKVKDLPARLWYMRQTMEQGWSRDTLAAMIKGKAHERQGGADTRPAG